jgi:hypothetical protein
VSSSSLSAERDRVVSAPERLRRQWLVHNHPAQCRRPPYSGLSECTSDYGRNPVPPLGASCDAAAISASGVFLSPLGVSTWQV